MAKTTSSKFKVLDLEIELLIAITIASQHFGNEHRNNRALTSLSKFTPTYLTD